MTLALVFWVLMLLWGAFSFWWLGRFRGADTMTHDEALAEIRRLRDALVSARWHLAKARPMWNGDCHKCEAALHRGLTGQDARSDVSEELATGKLEG